MVPMITEELEYLDALSGTWRDRYESLAKVGQKGKKREKEKVSIDCG
jgi:hypothetical protein